MKQVTPEEAYEVWLKAYSKNYGGIGLMDSEAISKQAWSAAINYERGECAKRIEYSIKAKGKDINLCAKCAFEEAINTVRAGWNYTKIGDL